MQYGYVEQAVAEAKAALATKELPKPETVLANAKAGVEKTVAVAKEVVDLAVAAQQRAYEVLTQRGQASVERAQGGRRLTSLSARCGGDPGITGQPISAVISFDAERAACPFPVLGHRSY